MLRRDIDEQKATPKTPLEINIDEQTAKFELQKRVLNEAGMDTALIDNTLAKLEKLKTYIAEAGLKDRREQMEQAWNDLVAQLEEILAQYAGEDKAECGDILENLKEQHIKLMTTLSQTWDSDDFNNNFADSISESIPNRPIFLKRPAKDCLYDLDSLNRFPFKNPHTEEPFNATDLFLAPDVHHGVNELLLKFKREQEPLIEKIQALKKRMVNKEIKKESAAIATINLIDDEESEGRREALKQEIEAEYQPSNALQMSKVDLLHSLIKKQEILLKEFFNFSLDFPPLVHHFKRGEISWERFLAAIPQTNTEIFTHLTKTSSQKDLIKNFKSQFELCFLHIVNADHAAVESEEIKRFIDIEYYLTLRTMCLSGLALACKDTQDERAALRADSSDDEESEYLSKPSKISLDDYRGMLRLRLIQRQVELITMVCMSIRAVLSTSGSDGLNSIQQNLEVIQSRLNNVVKPEGLFKEKQQANFYRMCAWYEKYLFSSLECMLVISSVYLEREIQESWLCLTSFYNRLYKEVSLATMIDEKKFNPLTALTNPYQALDEKIRSFHENFFLSLVLFYECKKINPLIFVTGQLQVGKTSIISALKLYDTLDDFTLWEIPRHELENRKYSKVNVMIIVFDIHKPESFSSELMEGWMREIRTYASPNMHIIFFCNKNDLIGTFYSSWIENVTKTANALSQEGFTSKILIGSVKKDEGIENLFTWIKKIALSQKQEKKPLSASPFLLHLAALKKADSDKEKEQEGYQARLAQSCNIAAAENNLVVKIAVLGEQGVGKSAIISRKITNTFSNDYTPGDFIIDKKVCTQQIAGQRVKFELSEIPASCVDKKTYAAANVIIIVLCANMLSTHSTQTMRDWIKELEMYATPDTPVIFFLNKADTMSDSFLSSSILRIEKDLKEATSQNKMCWQLQKGSAKDGSNLASLFNHMANIVPHQQKVKQVLPALQPAPPSPSFFAMVEGVRSLTGIGNAAKPKPPPKNAARSGP